MKCLSSRCRSRGLSRRPRVVKPFADRAGDWCRGARPVRGCSNPQGAAAPGAGGPCRMPALRAARTTATTSARSMASAGSVEVELCSATPSRVTSRDSGRRRLAWRRTIVRSQEGNAIAASRPCESFERNRIALLHDIVHRFRADQMERRRPGQRLEAAKQVGLGVGVASSGGLDEVDPVRRRIHS